MAETVPAVRGEHKWPVVVAVLVSIAMQFSLPDRHALSPSFLLPAVELLLLVVVIVQDPGRIDRRSMAARRVMLALVAVMSLDNVAAVVELVTAILRGDDGETGGVLLATGAAIWVTNVIAFSMWFWLLDRGGPAERAHRSGIPPAFLFGEMQAPEFVREDWSPEYIDYLYLAFTNSSAFSPTDTLPLTTWAKLLMFLQSAISLVVAIMIIARAVNILT